MMEIYVPDYWPWLAQGEFRRFDYTDPEGTMPPITSVFAWDVGSASMLYIDYDAHLNWKDTWRYKNIAGEGVAEYRDDYPGKKVVMSTPILWGERVKLGDSIMNNPKMDPMGSWPPAMSHGVQIVSFENVVAKFRTACGKVYSDVLVFTYLQSWNNRPGAGARYFMAREIGPVAVQWLAQDPTNPYGKPLIQTSRMDAVVTDVRATA